MTEPCVEIEGVDETLRRGSGIERSQFGHGEREGLWHCGKQRFRQDQRPHRDVLCAVPAGLSRRRQCVVFGKRVLGSRSEIFRSLSV